MNQSDFEQLQQHIRLVFSDLYLIDVDNLTADQRVQHQAALSAAYLALVKAENATFEKLDSTVKIQLTDLARRIHALQAGLKTLDTDGEKLKHLAQDLDGVSRLARLLSTGS